VAKGIPWDQIKRMFVEKRIEVRALEREFEVDHQTIEVRAERELWIELRDAYEAGRMMESIRRSAEDMDVKLRGRVLDAADAIAKAKNKFLARIEEQLDKDAKPEAVEEEEEVTRTGPEAPNSKTIVSARKMTKRRKPTADARLLGELCRLEAELLHALVLMRGPNVANAERTVEIT
jgi:hypothetical protein